MDINIPLAYSIKMKEGQFKEERTGVNPGEELSLIKKRLPELIGELADRGVVVELGAEGPAAVARKGAKRVSFKMEGAEAVIEYKTGDTVRTRVVNPRSSEFEDRFTEFFGGGTFE